MAAVPLDGSWWIEGPSMGHRREAGTQSTLADGRVLVCGGSVGRKYLRSCEFFDPETSTWSSAPPMARRRSAAAQATLTSGRVLVVGGYDGESRKHLATTEFYDPATKAWSPGPPMAVGRVGASLAPLPDGRALVCGGNDAGETTFDSAEIFDPIADGGGKWAPAAQMGEKRVYGAAAALKDGRVIVCGGSDGYHYLSSCVVFDPVSNGWMAAADMDHPRYFPSASTLHDGSVLACGGFDGVDYLRSTAVYDPRVNTWRAGPAMGQSRYYATQSTLLDGRILLCGGSHGVSVSFDSTEIFESGTVLLPPLPSREDITTMSVGERANALRAWLKAAEDVRAAKQARVDAARDRVREHCDAKVAAAEKKYDSRVDSLEARLRHDVAAAAAERDDRLQQTEGLFGDAEKLIARIQHQAEELERFRGLDSSEREEERTSRRDEGPKAQDARATGATAGGGDAPKQWRSRSRSKSPGRRPTVIQRPDDHFCSITGEVMQNPVLLVSCGDTFDEAALEQWLSKKDVCPLCKTPTDKVFVPNKALRRMIRDWHP